MPDRLIGRGADERYANEPTGPAGARLMPRAAASIIGLSTGFAVTSSKFVWISLIMMCC